MNEEGQPTQTPEASPDTNVTETPQPKEEQPKEAPKEEKPINEALSAEMDSLLKNDDVPSSAPFVVEPTPETPAAPAPEAQVQNIPTPTPATTAPAAAPVAAETQPAPEATPQKPGKGITISSIVAFIVSIIASVAIGPGTLLFAYMTSPFSWIASMIYLPYAEMVVVAVSIVSCILLTCNLITAKKKYPEKIKTVGLCTIFSTIVYTLPWLATAGFLHIRISTYSIISAIVDISSVVLMIFLAKKLQSNKSDAIYITALIIAIIGLIISIILGIRMRLYTFFI